MEDNRHEETLEAVLARLTAGEKLDADEYPALSDLAADEVEQVRATWTSMPAELREITLTAAAEVAEERLELDFTALARVGLDDPAPEVRISALEAIGDSTFRPLGQQVHSVFDNDDDERVRAGAAVVLRQFVLAREFDAFNAEVGDAIVNSLRAHFEDPEEDGLVRALSLEALGPRSLPWMPGLIGRAYASEGRELRLAALRAMADSCDERWLDYVEEQMESEDAEFRYEAAVAAGAIGSVDAVEAVAHLLVDDDPRVLLAAIEALGEIGGSAALEELRAFQPHAPEGAETTIENAIAMAGEIAALEDDEVEEDDD